MALSVLTSEVVEASDLPMAELAARMRMPDGWQTIPDTALRLEGRLQAALRDVERRTAHVLVRRQVTLGGAAEGGSSVVLGRRPVASVVSVEADRGRGLETVADAVLRADGRLDLPVSLQVGAELRVTVEAGYGTWADIPADLAEIVLLIAEFGETGDGALTPVIQRALAPFLPRRLGRLA